MTDPWAAVETHQNKAIRRYEDQAPSEWCDHWGLTDLMTDARAANAKTIQRLTAERDAAHRGMEILEALRGGVVWELAPSIQLNIIEATDQYRAILKERP